MVRKTLPKSLLAQYTGIDEQTLYNWDKRGFIPKSEDVKEQIKAVCEHLRKGKDRPSEAELLRENTRLAREKANKLELENKVRAGELIEAAQIEKLLSSAIAACRVRLLAIPKKLACEIAPASDPFVIEQLLKREVYEALEELAIMEITDQETCVKNDH